MRTAGIICECNPMHRGHRYLIERARADGAEAVICVMSGCFTQRGEPAVLDPRTRAEILLESGADAVLELPFPHSSAGAEFFAVAGVSILDRLGVDELWFGSECGDTALLGRAAEIASGAAFRSLYAERCTEGTQGTAEAYFSCLRTIGGEAFDFAPNDILGIAYMRAIRARSSPMMARTVARVGSGFHEQTATVGNVPSASALRRLWRTDGLDALEPYLSAYALSAARARSAEGLAPVFAESAERAILSFFRLTSPERLEEIPELSGGLGRRMVTAAKKSVGLRDFLEHSATKKYPEARIRRGIWFAMTGICAEDLRREPAYAVLLAANATGCRFLGSRRRLSELSVVTSHAGIPHTWNAKRQEELTRRAFALYTLCLPEPKPSDIFLHFSARIVK